MILDYKFKPRPYQEPVLKAFDKGKDRIVWCCHRRGGKDITAWNIMIAEAIKTRGVYFYCFPSYAQAKKVIFEGMTNEGFDFIDFIPKQLIKNKNDAELKIRLVNGSLIRFVGTDQTDNLVGTNPRGIIFSEAAIQNEQAWHLLSPILEMNKGWAIFISTPRGVNWFYHLYKNSGDNWYSQLDTVEDTKVISVDKLREQQKLINMPDALFDQEYFCKFLEGADQVFKGFEELVYEGESRPERGIKYQLGVDLGKAVDFTVITAINLHNWHVLTPDRFNQLDWETQKVRIEGAAIKHNNARMFMDVTGLGDPIFDDLVRRGVAVEPFRFTEESRKSLLQNLAMKIDTKSIKLPRYQPLLDELKAMRYELATTPGGLQKIRMKVPEGQHDDCIMSLALAVWDLHTKVFIPKNSIERLLNKTPLRRSINKFKQVE